MSDHSDSNHATDTNPKLRLMALNALGSQTGWAIYCRRFKQLLAVEIDGKIFDPKTPEAERTVLVNARQLLNESYAPEKVRLGMLAVAQIEADRADRDKK